MDPQAIPGPSWSPQGPHPRLRPPAPEAQEGSDFRQGLGLAPLMATAPGHQLPEADQAVASEGACH